MKEKTTSRIRGTTPQIEMAAKSLRRQMTPAEKKLWMAIRGKKLKAMKFRAQHPVGRFILDFFCPEKKLAIEIDGGIHDSQRDRDKERDDLLARYGYRVVRFQNEDVLQDLSGVLRKIMEVAREI